MYEFMKTVVSSLFLFLAAGFAAHAQGPFPTQTIRGFCRQSGSLNIVPFALNTQTGAMTTFPLYTLGPDHAGHYSATGDEFNPTTVISGIQPTGTGATPEKLVKLDMNTGTITQAASGLSNAAFTGNSIAALPLTSPIQVAVAQAAPGTATSPSTNFYQIDVASGSVGLSLNFPYSATTSWRGSVARVVFDIVNLDNTSAVLLQPCVAGVPQQFRRIDLTNQTSVAVSISPAPEPANTCLDAPGLIGGVFFALANISGSYQLIDIDLFGGNVNYREPGPAGWRRAPASPYIYSATTQQIYALNDTQTTLARFDTTGGDVTAQATAVTVATPCVKGSITSFATVQ
jgi:hypothetical protein